MRTFFEFKRYKTGYRQETLAGLTTFLTMAYIIIVNPAILENAGIPKGPSITATILTAMIGTTREGGMPKVGTHSTASSVPRRPDVPAPT